MSLVIFVSFQSRGLPLHAIAKSSIFRRTCQCTFNREQSTKNILRSRLFWQHPIVDIL
jgi:hypothetical protein